MDNSFGTASFVIDRPEDGPKEAENTEQPHPNGVLKTASYGAVQAPKEPEGAATATSAIPAKPDKPPKVQRKKSDTADLVLGVDDIVAEGVTPANARQWLLVVRRDKRARLTPGAWERVKDEAQKAGISIDRAVQASVEFNWQGFDAEWYARRQNRNLPLARASPYPDAPGGAIPLVRGATMQSAELARQLLFTQGMKPQDMEKHRAAVWLRRVRGDAR